MKLRKSTPFRSSQFLAVAFSATVFCHFAASSASAQALYWDNDGATPGFGTAAGTWAAPTTGDATQGWSTDDTGATLPGSLTTTTGNTLNFGTATTGLAAGSIAITGTVNANSLNFGSAGPAGTITLSGGTIALGGTSPRITSNKSAQVIGSAINLSTATSFVLGTTAAGSFSLNGAISGTGNVTFNSGTGASSNTAQTIILGAANGYSGTTAITTANTNNNLTVRAGVVDALPTATVLTLDGGNGPANAGFNRTVAYDLNGKNQTIAGLSNNKTRNSTRFQRILNGTGTATLTINNTSPASSSFSGNVNGTGLSLTKIGTGTQILGAGNTLTGTTTISGGKLVGIVGGNCASSKVVIDNTVGTFGISVTDNTKTWTCKELAPTAAGEIEFSFGAVIPSTTVSPLTVTVPVALTGLADFTAATPKIRVTTDAALAPGTYPLMTWDTVSGTVPTTADLFPPLLLPQTEATLAVSGTTLNLVITSTAVNVVKADNPDNLNLGTSWVGGTTPDTNKLAVWDNTVTTANTTVLAADATWAGISILNPNGLVTINGTNTLTLGNAAIDIDLSTANTANLVLNCPLALGADNVWDAATTRTITLGGQISGAFPITKQGDGAVILSSAANNYSGTTTVAAGTLQLGASNVIPDGIGNGNVSVAGTLDLNGKSETVNGLSGAGIIDNTLTAMSPVLTVGANDQTSTFGGVIQSTAGTVNLTKTGTGTLTLSGTNTFTGNVAIGANSGTLVVGNAAPLDNVTGITMGAETTLRSSVNGAVINAPITLGGVGTTATIHASTFKGSGTTLVPFSLDGAIIGDGNLTLSGVEATNSYGLIILNAASSYTGSTRMTTVSGFAGGPPINANIFVRLGIENALPTTTVLTLDGGNGDGTGGRACELNLNGNNQTLAGLANVMSVTARNQTVTNTGAPATLTVNNSDDYTFGRASIHVFNSTNYTTRARIQGAISLVKSGVGRFTLVESHTYTGTTAITGGTLALGSSDVLPATAVSIGGGTLAIGATFTDTAGTLDITGAATINVAAGAQLVFADSSGVNTGTWAGNLSIGGFVSGTTLNFGSITGLTAQQLSKISATGFTNFGLDAEGDLTADPVSGGTFADWLLANAPATGFVTDSDNDGLSNGVENVLGSNPNAYNAGLTEVSSTATSVIFKHTLNPTVASDVTYSYEWSTDLTEWKTTGLTNTGLTTATITPSAPVLGVVTVTVTITGGPSAKLFGRLVARN